MTPAAPQPQRQAPVAAWIAQMIGTLVLAAAVLYFVRSSGISFAEGVLKDCRRGFVRSEIRDSIAGAALWHSAPVLRPRG